MNSPPSPGISIPTRSAAGASVSQISVSMASSWQKKNAGPRAAPESRQCSSSRFVMPLAPGIARLPPGPHARPDLVHQRQFDEDRRDRRRTWKHPSARSRIRLAAALLAGEIVRVSRSYFQCSRGSS